MEKKKIEEVTLEDVERGSVILIDKPAGVSSFGVVAKVRWLLKERLGRKVKVGHTGTLDPFATGLLVLLVGKGTKRAKEFLKLSKEYEAELRLGWTSTTGDPEGEIVKVGGDKLVVGREEILAVMEKFKGEIWQKVPRYSAVKIDGERAYKRARRGEEVEMPMRKVVVSKLELLDFDGEIMRFDCEVSSGTYVRALGEEIGKTLGVGGYLVSLRRLRVGEFKVEEAEELSWQNT